MAKTWFAIALAIGLAACGSADPKESTDNEGAELHGKCVDTVLCVQGYVWSAKSCSCVPDKSHHGGGGGPSCGTKSCGAGQYCCSSSCGICAPIGAMCPMIACSTPL
jgi:hypothetical protein